uniref:Cilia- and flagella-associated protein 36 n=1 Tax=Lutzomyia longipalpis TaxID=7200 RepID=A0A1B0CX58_LUTLO
MSEDNSWVFDSLVCFLHGPIWNAPLQTFIEEKSLIFDPNEKQDESNPEFITIHNEYKNLGLFQQIWAANDIRIFIRMMTQRNVELQLQALDLIERRQNSQPSTDETADVTEFSEQGGTEETAEKPQQESLESLDYSQPPDPAEIHEKSAEDLVEKQPEDAATINDKFQRLNLFFEKEQMSEESVKSRRDYLIAQRDKILQIKKQTAQGSSVAQKILTGENPGESADPPEASLLLRKTLARRLRNEVVDTPRD